MSNRNRVRGPPRSGGHATGQEEQDLWDQIREPLNRIAVLEAKAKISVQEIFDLEKGMKARELAGTSKFPHPYILLHLTCLRTFTRGD